MSGHNKYSKIKHIKAKTDAQKSKSFTKIVRLITLEAKKSGGNVDSPGMRLALEKAREANMPKDTIDRAVKKATTDNSAQMETVIYETYGPGGCAIVIEGLTDNKNRSAQEVKHALAKFGSELAAQGSASWAFTKNREGNGGWTANTTIPLSAEDGEKLSQIMDALDELDDVQDVYTNAE